MRVLFGSFFLFSNFYQLYLQNKCCVALANLWWSISKNQIDNWASLDLVMDIQSACFVDSLTEYTDPPNYVHYLSVK